MLYAEVIFPEKKMALLHTCAFSVIILAISFLLIIVSCV